MRVGVERGDERRSPRTQESVVNAVVTGAEAQVRLKRTQDPIASAGVTQMTSLSTPLLANYPTADSLMS